MRWFARVLAVYQRRGGSSLSANEASGQTVISCESVDWAAEEGGEVRFDKDRDHIYEYNAVDRTNETITLTSGLTAAFDEGTEVEPWNPEHAVRYAECYIEGQEREDYSEPVVVRVPNNLMAMLPVGTRRLWGEKVTIVDNDKGERLFLDDLIGVEGNVVTWHYQTSLSGQLAVRLPVPYAATLIEARMTAEADSGFGGADDLLGNIYESDLTTLITVDDLVIPVGEDTSEWVKCGGDNGYRVEKDERIRCFVDNWDQDVGWAEQPITFHIRAIPKGAS